MARKLYYRIPDDGTNHISDIEWEEVQRLQHWYNSEFFWTAGRLTFKMFAVFQNPDAMDIDEESLWHRISARRAILAQSGKRENEIIRTLEHEGLIITKKGGYTDNSVASGLTRVATNEWNAYLVCEFLLKASTIIPACTIEVKDEGEFIKPQAIKISNGQVILTANDEKEQQRFEMMSTNRRIFSTVDPAKYDNLPAFRTTVSKFNEMEKEEQHSIVSEWNWLGFEQNYDRNGDDIQGIDLNRKVSKFILT